MKYILITILVLGLSGCNIEGDTLTHHDNSTIDNTDNSIDNSIDYICTDNNNTECYTPDHSGYVDDEGNYNDVGAASEADEYDASDDAQTCVAKGFFFCPLTQTCNNVTASSGTCSN